MPNEVVFPLAAKRIWVAGHRGMVGAATARRLASEDCEILTASRAQVDLMDQRQTDRWVADHKPDAIILAAAKVGGIQANQLFPAEFLFNNLMIQANVVSASHRHGVSKLLMLGSSCIYPRLAAQPIAEKQLLSGPLEPTNQWYAIAKIAGVKLAESYRAQYGCDFISAMPTNLYGPGDNFDLATSHVIPALIRKAHEAKIADAPEMVIWGSGAALREFLHVADCADALIHLLKRYSGDSPVNVGCGEDLTIVELAQLICAVVGYEGGVAFDASKPDGAPRKVLNVERLKSMGWRPTVPLREGLRDTYERFLAKAS
ncbi:MAG TPA: GDP-L-fucose synthase [Caulobacteraceae bacterium]